MAKTLSKSAISACSRRVAPLSRADASTAANPVRELAPIGHAATGRDARGRFIPGNDGHLSTGVHSSKQWSALAPLLRAERITILDAKGYTEQDADPVMLRLVDAFNQSVVIANSYFEFLSQTGGPISAKGRTRRAVEGWSRATDRMSRLAVLIGLERKARQLESPVEWLNRRTQEREQKGAQHANPSSTAADD